MKTILSGLLVVGLMLSSLALSGCARVIQKEYVTIDGKSVLTRETEYDRIGDQELQGLNAERTEPNGVSIKVAVEHQKSEGKLQIEGVISALGEVIKILLAKDMNTEAGQLMAVRDTLKAVNQ